MCTRSRGESHQPTYRIRGALGTTAAEPTETRPFTADAPRIALAGRAGSAAASVAGAWPKSLPPELTHREPVMRGSVRLIIRGCILPTPEKKELNCIMEEFSRRPDAFMQTRRFQQIGVTPPL
eukprot:gene12135-biopygen3411